MGNFLSLGTFGYQVLFGCLAWVLISTLNVSSSSRHKNERVNNSRWHYCQHYILLALYVQVFFHLKTEGKKKGDSGGVLNYFFFGVSEDKLKISRK